ncbi:hypothetical protein BDV96DRAFT_604359 [Lophiotrema nucula]|uniref:Uncharacterized protein n=1 Tax=Lophiotrema nucula TaxID=690887 RepID=A0A6A5YS95_9PLEO|nr:hypothetical protein BDV96DRAFT_604359 [Lophiotrema nucula]
MSEMNGNEHQEEGSRRLGCSCRIRQARSAAAKAATGAQPSKLFNTTMRCDCTNEVGNRIKLIMTQVHEPALPAEGGLEARPPFRHKQRNNVGGLTERVNARSTTRTQANWGSLGFVAAGRNSTNMDLDVPEIHFPCLLGSGSYVYHRNPATSLGHINEFGKRNRCIKVAPIYSTYVPTDSLKARLQYLQCATFTMNRSKGAAYCR